MEAFIYVSSHVDTLHASGMHGAYLATQACAHMLTHTRADHKNAKVYCFEMQISLSCIWFDGSGTVRNSKEIIQSLRRDELAQAKEVQEHVIRPSIFYTYVRTPAVRVAGACYTQTPNRKACNRWDWTHSLLSYEARVWKNTQVLSKPSWNLLLTSVKLFLTPNSSLRYIAVIKILIFFFRSRFHIKVEMLLQPLPVLFHLSFPLMGALHPVLLTSTEIGNH